MNGLAMISVTSRPKSFSLGLASSWPGLSRPSTSLQPGETATVDARDKPGHDESNGSEHVLAQLRRRIAEIEKTPAGGVSETAGRVALGAATLDAVLGGGLARGALHEASTGDGDLGPLIGFAAGLAARASRSGGEVLWVQHRLAALEAGQLYGPGLDLFGLPSHRLLLLRTRRKVDALWAMEEGLKCPALSIVVAEFADRKAIDLTATRRLALAARDGGAISLLLMHHPPDQPSAAVTRWAIASAPSVARDAFGGLGQTALLATLTRNRTGRTGRWTLLWDAHAHAFVETLPVDLARPAADRPNRAGAAA